MPWGITKGKTANEVDDAFRVFLLPYLDRSRLKVIKLDGRVSYSKFEDSSKSEYHIIYKAKGKWYSINTQVYSIYHSDKEKDTEQVYNSVHNNINTLMNLLRNKSKSQTIGNITSIVTISFKNRTWKPAHVAAQMCASNLFSPMFPAIVEQMETRTIPKTCLHIALATQHVPTIRAILSLKADVTIIDDKGFNAVHYASMTTKEIFFMVLNMPYAKDLIVTKNHDGCTPLHLACYVNKVDIVQEILKMDLSIEAMTVSPPVPDVKQKKSKVKLRETNEKQKVHKGSITKGILDDLTETDIIYGGCPLHWVTTRRSLENLLDMGFDVNTRNMAEETPLHVMIKRRRLKCTVSILCTEEADIELRSLDGDTPLHEAVKQLDIPAVQALLIFDADINATNNLGQTPRHLAAAHTSQANHIILYALHALGAKRCEPSMKYCTAGCSSNGNFDGRPYSRWSTFEEETLYKKILLEPIVRQTLKDKREGKFKDKKMGIMLCLDGGGVRGLISAQILVELQKHFQKPLIDRLTWVVGTSTGSLVASLLSLNYDPKAIRRLYFRLKNTVMQGTKPYSSAVFDAILKSYINEEFRMSDIKSTRLLITATLADRHPAQLHVFRSYESPAEICGLSKSNFNKIPNCYEMKLWSACRASSSAPVFFNPHGPFIDGGVIANNPTLDAMTEVALHEAALKLNKREKEIQELRLVVSIGTGKIPVTLRDPLRNVTKIMSLNPAESYRNALLAKDLLLLILDQATGTDAHVVHRAQAWCCGIKVPYFRLNPPVSEALPLDMTEEEELVNLLWETKAYMYAMRRQLGDLIELMMLAEETKGASMTKIRKISSEKVFSSNQDVHFSKKDVIRDFEYDYKLQDTTLTA